MIKILNNIQINDPLEQFDPTGIDKTFANFYSFFSYPETLDQISSNLTIALSIILLIAYASTNIKNKSNRLTISDQTRLFITKLLTSFFRNTTIDTIRYGTIITTIFIIILLSNLLSLIIPTGETVTAHIIINFTISFICIIMMALRYLYYKKIHFFSIFVLPGVPLLILPFLILIETISYLARLISLAVRLFANITAGHVLVSLFGTVLLNLISNLNILYLLVIPFFLAILTLEFLVAFLQTYVFTVLLSSYLEELDHHL